MALVQIFRHVFSDHALVEFEQIEVSLTHLRGDLEAHMKELAETRVIGWRGFDVTQGRGVLVGSPGLNR